MSRLRSNALILFVNNAGGAALAFLISVVIGRRLGATGLGQYTFIVAWIAPLTMLADFGFGTLITRDVARDRTTAPDILRTANRTLPLIVVGVLIAAWIALLLAGLSPLLTMGIGLVTALVALDPWYGLYTALFRAFERMTPILIVNVGGLLIQMVLSVAAVSLGIGLIGVVAALVIVNIGQLATIWGWWRRSRYSKETGDHAGSPLPNTIRLSPVALLRRAAPFALAAVIGALGVRLNVLLLEHLAGDSAVGLYSAAGRFVEAGRLLPNAFFGALFPVLTALAAQPVALLRLFARAAVALGGISLALAIGLSLTAPLLLRLAYRDPFVAAAPTLILLAWSLLPAVLHGLLNLYFYSIGREGVVNRVSLLTLIGQAAIGWVLIGKWGAPGAALTLISVESAALLISLIALIMSWRAARV